MPVACSSSAVPSVTIRVSGKLFQDHVPYLEHMIQAASDCRLWVVLDVELLTDLDRSALFFLMAGESRDFDLMSCPAFVREWMLHEAEHQAA